MPLSIHNPIYCTYNHDGPGFLTPYQTDKKVFKTIPQSSVIGLLLEETNNYQIIQSDAISILQHDPLRGALKMVTLFI